MLFSLVWFAQAYYLCSSSQPLENRDPVLELNALVAIELYAMILGLLARIKIPSSHDVEDDAVVIADETVVVDKQNKQVIHSRFSFISACIQTAFSAQNYIKDTKTWQQPSYLEKLREPQPEPRIASVVLPSTLDVLQQTGFHILVSHRMEIMHEQE